MKQSSWIEHKGDVSIHDTYENPETGEKSWQDHDPVKLTNFENCREHYWEVLGRNGDIQCKHCHMPSRIVWGINIVRDGKLIKL
jgi:hypothetical protein